MLFRRQPVPIVQLGVGTTLMAKDVLLDVRDENEFLAGHAPDAWFCPAAELESIRWDLPMNLRIVCVSRTGDRGHAATDQLRQWGFNAANLEGGMIAWRRRRAAAGAGRREPGRRCRPHGPGQVTRG